MNTANYKPEMPLTFYHLTDKRKINYYKIGVAFICLCFICKRSKNFYRSEIAISSKEYK